MRATRFKLRRRTRTLPAHSVASADEPERPPHPDSPERELASREHDGLRVVLLWDPRDGTVAVTVADRREGRWLRFPVPGSRALDAFHHPFTYAR